MRAQPGTPIPRAEDVATIEAVMDAAYQAVSAKPGQARGRWWIVGGQFQNESPGLELPAAYGGARP